MEKNELHRLYIVERRGTREIAAILGVSQPTARKILQQNGIPLRSYAENKMPVAKGSHLSEGHKANIGQAMLGNENWRDPETGMHRNDQREMVTCDGCGKTVQKKQCHLRGGKHFCDRKCHGAWRSATHVGPAHPRYVERVNTVCANCGADIQRHQCELERSDYFFCSYKCNGEWKTRNLVGDKLYNYKGGYVGYYGSSWPAARQATRKRDEYKCQRCGKAEGDRELDVHHIIPFRVFGIDQHEKANSLLNLKSYCNACHKIVEYEAEVYASLSKGFVYTPSAYGTGLTLKDKMKKED